METPVDMRIRPLLLSPIVALSLAGLTACGEQPPAPPLVAQDAVHPAATALDVAGARTRILEFLHGYAGAARDGAAALARSVRTPELTRWAEWVRFQNQQLDGPLKGRAEINGLRLVQLQDADGDTVATFDLDASVSFVYRPKEGDPARRRYGFQGPISLVREGPAEWAVIDATRDGRAMTDSIALLGLAGSNSGLEVAVDSVFSFQHWSFNVVVGNGTPYPISFDSDESALVVTGDAGEVDQHPQSFTDELTSVEPGDTVRAQVIFPAPLGEVKAVRFSFVVAGGGHAAVEFSFEDDAPTSPSPQPIGEV